MRVGGDSFELIVHNKGRLTGNACTQCAKIIGHGMMVLIACHIPGIVSRCEQW